MGLPIEEELQQSKPFPTLEEELLVNLARTAAVLGHRFEVELKPYGLTRTQYNVLRILRGAGKPGLCQYEIRERMVAQVPDVPRLLKRMEQAGFISQRASREDRRAVAAVITRFGLSTLTKIDHLLEEMRPHLFQHMTKAQVRKLNELLTLAR